MRTFCLLALLALPVGSTAVAGAQGAGLSPRDTTPVTVVRAYVAAFNAKNLDAMMGRVATDFLWMSVSGDSLTDVGRGVDAFRQLIAGYFRAVPSARSELLKVDATGPWVTTHERTRWDASPGEVGGQTSLVVYEVRDGRIRRAWFYPSQPVQAPVSGRTEVFSSAAHAGATRESHAANPSDHAS